ncbi:MAG TPA: hypothetical protein VL486_12700 [Verrucomicrobiae bacterium]|nr:hypothetical protein [Verrucomicrobiae bacterium]
MALFGGMFGSAKHPKLDQLSQAIQTGLGLQLIRPDDAVLGVIDAMTSHDLISVANSRSVEGAQEVFRSKSLRAVVDPAARTLTLHVAPPEDIERELQAEHTAVNVLHMGSHHATSRIIRSFNPAAEPIKVTPGPAMARADTTAPSVPPAFEHLEATERLCPSLVDHLVKHGQLTTSDKDALKKIKPADYTLEARVVALEHWREEFTRRARRIHVSRTGGASLLNASTEEPAQESEEAVLRRFDDLLHWLGKLMKALEHKSIKFHGKPVWLPH